MKDRFLYLAATALMLGLIGSCASVRQTSAHQRTSSPEETFIGEVTRNPEIDYDNKYQKFPSIIYDETRKSNYYLDDDGKAQQYAERRVQIEGTLEQKNTTIRVDSIKPLN
jgi:hypothetical protein